MPTYPYACPTCGNAADVQRPVDERDQPMTCLVCQAPMKRQPAVGMAVVWAGKFHDPWAAKKQDALGDRVW